MVFAATQSIIRFPVVVLLEVGLHPLAKLEVVLVFGLDQLVDFDVSLDAILVKRALKHFVVINEFVFVFGAPLYAAELESTRVETVHYCAVD